MPSIGLSQLNVLDYILDKTKENGVIRYLQNSLLNNFNPDINGYSLLFMIPPVFSADLKNNRERALNVADFMTFSGVDFTPPQEQINTEKINSRSGGIPYATEFTTSEQFSAVYLDDMNLSIYKFHQYWVHYIWQIVEGSLEPDAKYLGGANGEDIDDPEFGAIDYMASYYLVKYKPNLKDMTYIGKCIGVFPQALPAKELIGQRSSNELTTLPFTYFCSAYRGFVTSNCY